MQYFSMYKDRKIMLGFGLFGLTATVIIAAVLVLTDPAPDNSILNTRSLAVVLILCPASLLGVPLGMACIDCERGSAFFYFTWAVIAVFKTIIYTIIGAAFIHLRPNPQ
jgi:hypothetical protein